MNSLKQKASYCCVAWGLLWASSVQASRQVLLLEDPSRPQPGLILALRIQLTDVAEVNVRAEPASGDVATRIQAATQLGQQTGVLLVVWADRTLTLTDGSQEAVLYAVGQQKGRALLEVVRAAGGQGPDMDRTLALKIREIVSELERAQTASPTPAMLAVAPARPDADRRERTLPVWGGVFALRGLGGPEAAAPLGQWGAGIGAGPSLGIGALRISALLGLDWFPAVTLRRNGSSIALEQLVPGLLLRSQWRRGPLWLGVSAGFAFAFVAAAGRTQNNAYGEASTRLATWLTGVELELPLEAGFTLGFSLELALRMRHQRFLVNAAEVADLSRVRPLARLSLFWHTPADR